MLSLVQQPVAEGADGRAMVRSGPTGGHLGVNRQVRNTRLPWISLCRYVGFRGSMAKMSNGPVTSGSEVDPHLFRTPSGTSAIYSKSTVTTLGTFGAKPFFN